MDCETGEALAKPKVTVFKVKHEVEKAPKVNLTISEDGKPVFTWKLIKGAERYYVMSLVYNEDSGFSGSGLVRASTDETEWTPESNGQFVTYAVSEADRSEQYYIEEYGEGTEAIPRNSEYDTYYCCLLYTSYGVLSIYVVNTVLLLYNRKQIQRDFY